jgi:hypothetical protein
MVGAIACEFITLCNYVKIYNRELELYIFNTESKRIARLPAGQWLTPSDFGKKVLGGGGTGQAVDFYLYFSVGAQGVIGLQVHTAPAVIEHGAVITISATIVLNGNRRFEIKALTVS